MTDSGHTDGLPMRGGPLSRKRFLAGSAALLGGGALAAALPRAAEAHDTPEPPTDIDILNYALTLEHLEYRFYEQQLARFDAREISGSSYFDGLGFYIIRTIRGNLVVIREHEQTHVDTLVSVIESLGGEPVPESEYDFGVRSVAGFVRTARLLENTGVSAYDGAIAHIESAEYLTAGATIATVEARHAAYLNLLNRDNPRPNGLVDRGVPFPAAFDEPIAPRTVCEAVQGFIASSPTPYGPYESLDTLCALLPSTTTP